MPEITALVRHYYGGIGGAGPLWPLVYTVGILVVGVE
jgi:hypothetical protein